MNEAQEENGLNPVFRPDEIPLEGNNTDWQDKIFGMRFPNHITSVSVERKKAFLIS